MTFVIDINRYRNRKRRAWLVSKKNLLERFLTTFIQHYLPISFADVSASYQSAQQREAAHYWDYEDLREVLQNEITASLGDILYQALNGEGWFDRRWLSKEEAIDYCVSLYITTPDRRPGHATWTRKNPA